MLNKFSVYSLLNKAFLLLLLISFTTSCGFYEKVDQRQRPDGAKAKARKNVEEGRGVSLGGLIGKGKGGSFEFSSSNPMWRASLETLDFLPMTTVDYSGGIIITDWYTDTQNSKKSIKITIRFLSNEVRVDALSIKVFTKQCGTNIDCQISENEGSLPTELKKNILKKAAIYEKQNKDKNFKEYQVTTPGDNKKE